MNMLLRIVMCLIVGYLFGCFSSGYFVGKLYRTDVRKYGSGNLGATNVLRTLGAVAGGLTLFLDLAKCFIPILLVRYVVFPEYEPFSYMSQLYVLYISLGVVVGHDFPFYLKFHGGKGIACMGAVMLLFDWRLALFGFITFCLIIVITKYVSVASLFESILFPVWVTVVFKESDVHMVLVTCMFTLLAFFMHRSNLVRLANGTENKFGVKKNGGKKE